MASPPLDSVCCNLSIDYLREISDLVHSNKYTYNICCLLSSSLGSAAALYQLVPFRRPVLVVRSNSEMENFRRQNHVISWLTVTNLFASLFIFIRSIVWLCGLIPGSGHSEEDSIARLLCAFLSGVIQFFYMSTYIWTLSYTVEVFLLLHNRKSGCIYYHIVGWGLPAIFTLGGMLPLYLPSLNSCSTSTAAWLPHLLVTYILILTVMIVNPILYTNITRTVRHSLRSQGVFTDRERHIIRRVRHKSRMVATVFFVCWSPNLVEGVLRIFVPSTPACVTYALWHYMAIVNPMQSFVNALVYSSSLGSCHFCGWCCCCNQTYQQQWQNINADSPTYRRMSLRQRAHQRRETPEQQVQNTDFDDSTEVSALLANMAKK